MTAARSVPVSDIRTELEALTTQVRIDHDADTIEAYADAMKAKGAAFPPVSLVEDGKGKYFIADGWHRVLAARRAKAKRIPARVLPCLDGLKPLPSAVRYALRANCEHGLRLSRGDERNKARRAILEVPGMAALRDRAISREIGVSHQTVSRVRAELVRERLIPHSGTGERMDELMPDEYAGLQAFRAAFGNGEGGVEEYRRVRAYLAQLQAARPTAWTYNREEQRVYHHGLLTDHVSAAFEAEGNPVINGLPRDWEPLDPGSEDIPTTPLSEGQRVMIERMNARREFEAAMKRIEAHQRQDLLKAAQTIKKYRDVPGLFADLRALVLAGGPSQEHLPSDF